mgnify:CR=1
KHGEQVLEEKKKTEALVDWLAGKYDGEESVKNSRYGCRKWFPMGIVYIMSYMDCSIWR